MKKSEFSKLLVSVESFFPGRVKVDQVAQAWWEVLKDYDFDRTMWSLNKYVLTAQFPPTISDLVQDQANRRKSESNQTAEEVMENANKSFEQRQKEMDEEFASRGLKIVWGEEKKIDKEIPEWLAKRINRGK